MTFIEFAGWQPGMVINEERANSSALIGRVVFRAIRNTNQSIPSGTENVANAIQWNVIGLDLLGGWDVGQPTRWTVPLDGWWELAGSIGYNQSTGGTVRDALWFANGFGVIPGRGRGVASTAIADGPLTAEARTLPVLLSAGDYVELVPGQNSGSALNTATGTFSPYMSVKFAGPA